MGDAWRMAAVMGLAMAVAGCSIGGLAPIGPSVVPPVESAAAASPVAYGAFLEGPIGQKLSASDRDKALAAQQTALASGQRQTWRGEAGTYGYVEPTGASRPALADGTPPPAGAADACRDFTSTVYLGGRPQVGHGRGCQNPDGSYRIVG